MTQDSNSNSNSNSDSNSNIITITNEPIDANLNDISQNVTQSDTNAINNNINIEVKTTYRNLEPHFDRLISQIDTECIGLEALTTKNLEVKFIDNGTISKNYRLLGLPTYNYGKTKKPLIFTMSNITLDRPGIASKKYRKNNFSDYKLKICFTELTNNIKRYVTQLKALDTFNKNLHISKKEYMPIVKNNRMFTKNIPGYKGSPNDKNLETYYDYVKFYFCIGSKKTVATKIYLSHQQDPESAEELVDLSLDQLYVLLNNKPIINLICSFPTIAESSNVYNASIKILVLKILMPERKNMLLKHIGVSNTGVSNINKDVGNKNSNGNSNSNSNNDNDNKNVVIPRICIAYILIVVCFIGLITYLSYSI